MIANGASVMSWGYQEVTDLAHDSMYSVHLVNADVYAKAQRLHFQRYIIHIFDILGLG